MYSSCILTGLDETNKNKDPVRMTDHLIKRIDVNNFILLGICRMNCKNNTNFEISSRG
jgi:hypothetical protein